MRTLLTLLLALVGANVAAQPAHPVILVSIDGFRPDYLTEGVTPNLNRLAAQGVRAEGMRPSFPSITFPNHYTLVTGKRPDHHGLVDNVMSDPAISDERFTLSNAAAVTDHRWWDQAEPVWVTAELHGVHSATMFWPGSEAAIHGVRPTIAPKFDGKLPAAQRVDTLLSWLDQPGQQFGFLTLYFDDVDHAGHSYGPAAAETTEAVAQVDQAIGRLLDGLAARHVEANIVVVSDHGMAPVSTERVIRMQDIAPAGSYEEVVSGSYAGMNAVAGKEQQLAAALLKPQQHMQCWRKEEIPARLAYGHNARVPAFLCLADDGWSIVFSDKSAAKVKGGKHGYDNALPDMRATFIAAGPAFAPGVVLPVFDNVDVYPLLMRLIGVAALPSDGDITPLLPALAAGQ
ncbi:alkaline phosphatase family protein [Duganella sp. FT80W]|uniref:Alkaline phosphatase family protein n=1 Tax=Duganella guangzhouensis TaxID=2666084 RepID=A0A6I2L3T2_9BURK|nr:ectonucleotide pyrophosphatase/phosphodiesterase [Duganella guangzhouensis]MRW92400.1 alkaline phosphatase family protein [Duganella guangzhouensis]